MIDLLGLTLDRAMAEGIYTAVSTDTGCFRFSNTTAQSYETARRCALTGIDMFGLNLKLFMIKSRSRIATETHVMNNVIFDADGRIASCVIRAEDMKAIGTVQDDLDDISSVIRYIEGVEISIIVTEYDYGAKVSVRTSPDYDAGRICRRFGGGGHASAAGCTIKEDAELVRQNFVSTALEILK